MSNYDAGLAQISGAELYAGPDLAAAFSASLALTARTALAQPAPKIPKVLDDLFTGALNASAPKIWPASVLVIGQERLSATTMRILFRGRLRAVDFCARHILGTTDFEQSPVRSNDDRSPDVLVADHPLVDRTLFRALPAMRVPQWVRQRRALRASWQETVQNIPISLRKKIARLLGDASYTVRIEAAPEAKAAFYNDVYLPYVTQRFGAAAIVANQRALLHQARHGVLLELRLDGQPIGATLVGREADTLYMSKSALVLGNSAPRAFDLLDYFCFLLAQLARCRWLDFGVSRPHLEDGVFVNKTKWRPELAVAGGLKTDLRIRPMNRSPATLGFLSRNGFIERRGGQFIVRRLLTEGMPSPRDAAEIGDLATRSGLDALIVAFCDAGETSKALANLDPWPRLRRLTSTADPLRSFLLHA